MTTLAYYSSVVKKEEILERISLDAEQIASIANDLVCDIKTAAAASKTRDIETLIDSLTKAQDLTKVVSTMIDNLKNNSESYISTMLTQQKEQVQEQREQVQEQKEQVQESSKKELSPQDQLMSLVETLKSLKEMQQSIEDK